ncbi:MAG: phenylalanine--tRNA ligase subunit beta [Candidatus Omnitrophota bacterium]
MKLSYEWIKEYVKMNLQPEELAKALTMSGSEVSEIEDVNDDKVMELEITSNRPDCLNMIGLAREVSAVLDKSLVLPAVDVFEDNFSEKEKPLKCVIKNKKLCPRYTARIIADAEIKNISENIGRRLTSLGMRLVNNAVDITNFCLMEMGQPLHAFDLDRISGGKIIVREAVKGERIVTIDDVERSLEPGMLVIADAKGPIAIAGVMGGKDTEVTEKTRNILLESAYFDPLSIRRTARLLGLSSDSSYRFERGVDKANIKKASDRAAILIKKETGGRIVQFYNEGTLIPEKIAIVLDIEKTGKLLGRKIAKEEIFRILSKLGMVVSRKDEKTLNVEVPSFREDVRSQVDLIEEVARIYGYHNIPATVANFVPQITRKEKKRKVIEGIRTILAGQGLNEIMNYSLIDETAAKRFSFINEGSVSLRNPLSEEQKILTPQLLSGMLHTVSWNLNRKNNDLGFFEIGKLYLRGTTKDSFDEIPALCVGLTGRTRKSWQEKPHDADFYDLKGMVEEMMSCLKIDAKFEKTKIKGMINSAAILINNNEKNKNIGFIAEIGASFLKEYDISQAVYICHIRLDEITEKSELNRHYISISRFPSSSRDMSILCDKTLDSENILEIIREKGDHIIQDIDLVDVYEGEQIPEGKKSLTYSISYGLDTRTLTEAEIQAVHSNIQENLIQILGISFR